jgi:predicted metal-dependent hydrolase
MTVDGDAADAAASDAQLREACELFNAGSYHRAHEVLDALWEASEGGDADFFKGLIQAAIALHHYSRGNYDGARKLYSGHRRYLAAYVPAHRGLDVARFLVEMQRTLQPLVRADPGGEPAFDRTRAPRLEPTASAE